MRPLITNKTFASVRPKLETYATDSYYVRLANSILKILMSKYNGNRILNVETLTHMALKVTWYFEDIVADMGIWRSFSELCQKMYGFPVPMYHDEEEYYSDEPSLNAIKYLVWDVTSEMHDDMTIYPDTGKLADLSNDIYTILDNEFENAPVNDDAKEGLKKFIKHSSNNFNDLRDVLYWINAGNYMTRNMSYLADVADAIEDLHVNVKNFTEGLKRYYVKTHFLFQYKTGPLALNAKEWLSDLARVYELKDEKQLIDDIEVHNMDTWQIEQKDDEWVHLKGVSDKEIDVHISELNMDDNLMKENDACIAQFIFFKGEWHLNGVIYPINTEGKFDELKADYMLKPGEQILSTEKMMKATKGRRLLYYKNVDEMMIDLKQMKLIAKDQTFPFVNKPDYEMPCFFINETDKKDNMYFGFNFEQNIKDPDNPYYDAKIAKEEAVTMLWDESIPSELIDWLIDQDFVPDIAKSKLFRSNSTKEQTRSDMHFMVRYLKRKKY